MPTTPGGCRRHLGRIPRDHLRYRPELLELERRDAPDNLLALELGDAPMPPPSVFISK